MYIHSDVRCNFFLANNNNKNSKHSIDAYHLLNETKCDILDDKKIMIEWLILLCEVKRCNIGVIEDVIYAKNIQKKKRKKQKHTKQRIILRLFSATIYRIK